MALPDWLKDMRQQARNSAEEDAQAAALSKPHQTEPPDLLAGLASQGGSSDDDDIPDWLTSIKPAAQSKPAVPSTPEPNNDFFAQFNQDEPKSEPVSEPPQAETPSWTNLRTSRPLKGKTNSPIGLPKLLSNPRKHLTLMQIKDGTIWVGRTTWICLPPRLKNPLPKRKRLSWLHNLEAASKQTSDLQAPKQEKDWTASFDLPSNPPQSSSQQDLSWLDKLGGIDEPAGKTFEQPAAPQNDLSWWTNLAEPQRLPNRPSLPLPRKI